MPSFAGKAFQNIRPKINAIQNIYISGKDMAKS